MPERREPPKVCDACQSLNIVYTTETAVGRIALRRWPWIYYCKDCQALVGCHPGSTSPLGVMANAFARKLRAELHDWLDPLWQQGYLQRTQVYGHLAGWLCLDVKDCHIATLSTHQLTIAIEMAQSFVQQIEESRPKRTDPKQRISKFIRKERIRKSRLRTDYRKR